MTNLITATWSCWPNKVRKHYICSDGLFFCPASFISDLQPWLPVELVLFRGYSVYDQMVTSPLTFFPKCWLNYISVYYRLPNYLLVQGHGKCRPISPSGLSLGCTTRASLSPCRDATAPKIPLCVILFLNALEYTTTSAAVPHVHGFIRCIAEQKWQIGCVYTYTLPVKSFGPPPHSMFVFHYFQIVD